MENVVNDRNVVTFPITTATEMEGKRLDIISESTQKQQNSLDC